MLIPLLVGVWVFLDARSRGKDMSSSLLWGMGTFLLLIIVLPLWLFLRPPLGKSYTSDRYSGMREQNSAFEEQRLFCTHCQQSIEGINDALFCPYCGQRLSHKKDPINIEADQDE